VVPVCVCVCVSEAALAEMGVALKDDSSLVGVFSPKQVSSRLYNVLLLYDINSRYDTRCYFNVRSKADMSQLNLPHGTDS